MSKNRYWGTYFIWSPIMVVACSLTISGGSFKLTSQNNPFFFFIAKLLTGGQTPCEHSPSAREPTACAASQGDRPPVSTSSSVSTPTNCWRTRCPSTPTIEATAPLPTSPPSSVSCWRDWWCKMPLPPKRAYFSL